MRYTSYGTRGTGTSVFTQLQKEGDVFFVVRVCPSGECTHRFLVTPKASLRFFIYTWYTRKNSPLYARTCLPVH